MDVTADVHLKSGKAFLVDGGDEVHLKASSKIVLESPTMISLVCGGNFISLGPAGIDIKGTHGQRQHRRQQRLGQRDQPAGGQEVQGRDDQRGRQQARGSGGAHGAHRVLAEGQQLRGGRGHRRRRSSRRRTARADLARTIKMPNHVCNGATLACTFGMAPGTLVVLPKNMVLTDGQPAANIMDNIPIVNIMPFGNCMSVANPTVAAATAAALGVLTPMPCVPMIPGAVGAGLAHVTLAFMPALNKSSS
jgi:hypothetical protein